MVPSNHYIHLSSSNRRVSQIKPAIVGDSNEGCSRGDAREDPPQDNIKKTHMINPPHNIRKSQKSSKEVDIF